MIQFVTVSKTYDNNYTALNELNFNIEDGEFVFLVGPSGSGKTTIIKLLIREEVPTIGKIYFDDEDITKFNRDKVYHLRRKIGVIFQDFKLINELTAYENIAFAMEAAGKPDSEIKENVPYLLDIVGLTHRMKAFPYQLSGGEKQRVAIARAMANNPKLLIADEPTGNLDPESAWDIAQILYKINNWGTTVLMSTHGSDIVNSMHKRVIRLQSGQIIRDDFKGGYDDVDEYSLRIITSTSEEPAKLKSESKKPEQIIEEIVKEEKQKITPKEESSKKKISFSIKKKPKVVLTAKKEEIINEAEIDAEKNEKEKVGDKEEAPQKAITIEEMDLNKTLKQYLQEKGYENIDDLIDAGNEQLRNIDKLTDIQLRQVNKAIKKYKS
jgi:cell division transport system ATP-binding protein